MFMEIFMINIALDGLSGSGEGALADGLAKKMNLIHLVLLF